MMGSGPAGRQGRGGWIWSSMFIQWGENVEGKLFDRRKRDCAGVKYVVAFGVDAHWDQCSKYQRV